MSGCVGARVVGSGRGAIMFFVLFFLNEVDAGYEEKQAVARTVMGGFRLEEDEE